MKRLALLALLAGCTVVDTPYPAAWDPLGSASSDDCRRFQGTYADRGEAPGQVAPPSLTRELFGPAGPWKNASTVRFEFSGEDTLDVSVAGEGIEPVVRRLSAKDGGFRCEDGKLVLRNRRWVASGLMSGRETVTIDAHRANPFLVTHVQEAMSGVMFMVVPLSGESARWFRFRRLAP